MIDRCAGGCESRYVCCLKALKVTDRVVDCGFVDEFHYRPLKIFS
jgi:hypothetical protein